MFVELGLSSVKSEFGPNSVAGFSSGDVGLNSSNPLNKPIIKSMVGVSALGIYFGSRWI
jgi:hypothetical protein